MEQYFSYILYFGVLILTFSISKKAKKNKFMFFLLVLIPSVIVGFRGFSVGRDTSSYVASIKKIWEYGVFSRNSTEYGFRIFEYLVYAVFRNEHAVLFSVAFLTYFFYYFSLHKIIKDEVLFPKAVLFVTSFVFFPSMSGIRQCLAASLVLYFVYLFSNKKYVTSAFILIIAFSIHTSALVGILFGVVCLAVYSTKHKPLSVFAAISFALLFYYLYFEVIQDKYSHLFEDEQAGSYGLYYIFIIIISVILFFWVRPILKRNKTEIMESFGIDNINLYIVLSLGYPFTQLLSVYSRSFSRISWYFVGFFAILFLIAQFDKKNKYFFSGLMYFVCLYNFISLMANNGYYQIPYIFYA